MNNAPETCDQRAADMWSFAIILWELATREVPFAELSPMEMGMKVFLNITCLLIFLFNQPSQYQQAIQIKTFFYHSAL